jgi:type IV fimbrial biogenesis protein FimT
MSGQLTSVSTKHLLKASQGLSLIELLVTVSVVSILLSVGLPSLGRMIDKNRAETATYDLLTAIQTTRSLAVTKHQRAVLKAKGEWHQGWELFIDTNDNGVRDSDETLVSEQSQQDVTIKSTSQKMKTISFINTGESRQASGSVGGSFLAGTLTVCSLNKQTGFKLVLARGGRTRLATATCS